MPEPEEAPSAPPRREAAPAGGGAGGEAPEGGEGGSCAWAVPLALLAGLSVLITLDARGGGRLRAGLDCYVAWTAAHAPWSLALYVLTSVLALMLGLPLVLLVGGASALFSAAFGYAAGVVLGTAAMSFADLCAGSVSLLLGRSLLRGPMERKLRGDDRFRAVRAVHGLIRSRGVEMTLVVKLAPLPTGLLSYVLGCTPVSVGDFLLGSAIPSVPYVALICFVGSSAMHFDDFRRALLGSPLAAASTCAAALGLGAAAAALLARMRRQYLELLAQEDGAAPEEHGPLREELAGVDGGSGARGGERST